MIYRTIILWPGGHYGLERCLGIWHLWGSTIFGSKRLIKIIPICSNEIRQLSKLETYACIRRVTGVTLVINITLQGESSVRSHIHSILHCVIVAYILTILHNRHQEVSVKHHQLSDFNKPMVSVLNYEDRI